MGKSAKGAKRRIVMRLGPNQIPDLAPGDTILTHAEAQVTTRCDIGQSAAGCDYNPKIRAQLILTGQPGDKYAAGAQSRALSEPQTMNCTKAEHHCMFVFRPSATKHDLTDGFDLPCVADSSCFVNLVMWAWHPRRPLGRRRQGACGENEGNYLANGVIEGERAG